MNDHMLSILYEAAKIVLGSNDNKYKLVKSTNNLLTSNDEKIILFDTYNSIQLNNGRWTLEEHEKFQGAYFLYQNQWCKVQKLIKTRTNSQIRSHGQRYQFIRKENENIFKKKEKHYYYKYFHSSNICTKDMSPNDSKIEKYKTNCTKNIFKRYGNKEDLNHLKRTNPFIYVDDNTMDILKSFRLKRSESMKENNKISFIWNMNFDENQLIFSQEIKGKENPKIKTVKLILDWKQQKIMEEFFNLANKEQTDIVI